jgi:hypothetical protein
MAGAKKETQPTYVLGYPRPLRLARSGVLILLIGVALYRWGAAWVRFLRPAILAATAQAGPAAQGDAGQAILETLAAQPLRPLLAAHLGLLLLAAMLPLVYAFLPELSLADEGLAVRTLLGWRIVPWAAIRVVRIVSFQAEKRRLVLIQGRWTRWAIWPRLVSASLGAGFEPGLFLTSAIRDFKPLMRRLYQEVKKAAPDALFDDDFMSPSATLMLEPTPTLATLVEQARDEGWPLAVSAQVMAAVPAGLVLVQILLLLLYGGAWWKLLVIVGLCEMEWLVGAFYLYTLAEFFPARVEFREGALLYPLPQIPRALLALPMALLVAAGAPFLAAMLGLGSVLWAVVLTAILVQQLYRLDSVLPALIGGAFQTLLQFIIVALVFGA